MTLAAGTRLGPYEIVSWLGAGGMGEVYKATDTRLDRTVAIKILPEALAADPQFRARFHREARTLSQLTHPNICTLHDVGGDEGTAFLVMELLSGETLATRLERGPLPLREAMTTAIQIAEALDAAHRAGIVHRDLKPGNIMCTREGAKLLDFGLAKLRPSGQDLGVGMTATVTGATPLTGQGSILGTLPYMAPEQLEGGETDPRTDIFAFGAIVYEMVTGRRAFNGSSQASLIGAILKDDPPPIPSVSMTPSALDRVVRTCLAKDPDERWQSAGDLKRELKWIAGNILPGGALGPATPGRRGTGERLGWAVIGALIGSLATGFAVWRITGPAAVGPAPVAHLAIALPPDAPPNVRSNLPSLALSPDGSRLVYVAERGGVTQLYVRALDQTEARPVPGSEGARQPFFSPDGEWIGFVSNHKLKKMSMTAGTPINICDIGPGRGASWGPDGTITFSAITGLMQVSAAGGSPQPVTTLDASSKETAHIWPDVLPGGQAVLFTVWTGGSFSDSPIVVQSLKTRERRDLGIQGTFARYAASGHIVYERSGSLMAVPFDLSRLAVTGAAVPIIDGVLAHDPSGAAQFAISGNGSLVYVAASASADRTLVWVDRQGAVTPLTATERPFVFPRLSPDDQQVVFGSGTGISDIWLYEMTRDTFTRLTFEYSNVRPIWTPDGKRITFTSSRLGPLNLFWMPADGSSAPERLATSPYTQFPSSWSPDGRHLGVMEIHPTSGWDLWVLPRDDHSKPQPFVQTAAREGWMEFSPDGRWVAYTADESGRWEIYVRPFPGPGGKVQISSEGGTEAVWSRAGRELFYRDGDKMMIVAVSTEPTFTAAKPRLLFQGRYDPGPVPGMVNYDVSRDGHRFLMVKSQHASTPAQLDIVLDWFGELTRRAPPRQAAR